MQQILTDIFKNTPVIYPTLVIILLSIWYYALNFRGLPPGPIGLPLLGYWPFLKSETCHLQLQNLGKKYGSVFSFTATGRLLINLGSIKSVREALITNSDCFAQRTKDHNILNFYLTEGVVCMHGEPWKIVKKFLVQQFRERGMTVIREAFSGPIYDTVRETVTEIKKAKGEPVDISSILAVKCNRIMRDTLFGADGMTDEELKEFCDGYRGILMTMTTSAVLASGALAKYFIYPFTGVIREGRKSLSIMHKLLHRALNRRQSTYKETTVRDLLDAYIKERNDRKAKNDPTAKIFTDRALVDSLIQIVGDGVLFLALFIGAFIKVLLDHPEEQDKIYKELVEVVGLNRDPSIEDKSKLPYTNAFISEVMRTTDIFTIFPTLECTKETTLNGYRIPKGAILIYNFWMAHMNPEDYDQPNKFNPSRFIVKDGKKRPELPVIFGMGKRACIGEGYSMNQVFLFLTTIVKNFQLSKPKDLKEGNSIFFKAENTYVCAQRRNQ